MTTMSSSSSNKNNDEGGGGNAGPPASTTTPVSGYGQEDSMTESGRISSLDELLLAQPSPPFMIPEAYLNDLPPPPPPPPIARPPIASRSSSAPATSKPPRRHRRRTSSTEYYSPPQQQSPQETSSDGSSGRKSWTMGDASGSNMSGFFSSSSPSDLFVNIATAATAAVDAIASPSKASQSQQHPRKKKSIEEERQEFHARNRRFLLQANRQKSRFNPPSPKSTPTSLSSWSSKSQRYVLSTTLSLGASISCFLSLCLTHTRWTFPR